jgi:hypothetical protein
METERIKRELEEGNEYRIQYKKLKENQKDLEILLISGTAEIFGRELLKDQPYHFPPGSNFFIFTYTGCELEFSDFQEDNFIDYQKSFNRKSEHMFKLAEVSIELNELRSLANKF